MRTLITVKGKAGDPDDKALAACLKTKDKDGFWLDIENPSDEDYHLLEHTFGFHPLALEDVRNRNQRPKLEEYKGYTFMVLFQAVLGKDSEVSFLEHHLFLADGFLVTVHEEPAPILAELAERIRQRPDITKDNAGFLTYMVVDVLVDSLFPLLETLDETIDKMEDEILDNATSEVLGRIYKIKHEVIELRRFLGAQRDMFQKLITHSIDLHAQDLSLYWRDVHDHLIRQYETVDSLRDLLTGAMDVYLSTVSNRLNVTMKALTVIASLFLPLSFLTGFYGMNFSYLINKLEPSDLAFFIGVGTMLASIGIQLYYFKRRGWI